MTDDKRRPVPALPVLYMEALGIRTGYYALGRPDGRPVVLLHGMSTSGDSFRETLHGLADRHWLIAPDLPGFGFSRHTRPYTVAHLVEWLAAFQQRLNLPPMALVGHSFGSIVATSFALSYPGQVTRLLLVAPALLSARTYPETLKKLGISLGLVDLGAAVSQSRLWVQRQIRVPFYDPDRLDPGIWQRRLQDYQLARASADVIKVLAFYDVENELPRLSQPTCIVFGQNDPVVPAEDGQRLQSLLPDARLHLFAACGHVPMLEQPQRFQSVAHAFFSGADGATVASAPGRGALAGSTLPQR